MPGGWHRGGLRGGWAGGGSGLSQLASEWCVGSMQDDPSPFARMAAAVALAPCWCPSHGSRRSQFSGPLCDTAAAAAQGTAAARCGPVVRGGVEGCLGGKICDANSWHQVASD